MSSAATPASTSPSTTPSGKLRVGLVGIGKMGLSHLAMIRPHPDVDLVGMCDASTYVPGVLEKYTGITAHKDFHAFLRDVPMDAIIIATPSTTHAWMVRAALEKGLHVFCEKPFTLSAQDATELTALAKSKNLVTQVGYHNRFVGAFREVKRLVELGTIGEITHVTGEAYGPVVLKPKGSTWRTQSTEGGGCLYDYAAHAINLVNWYIGEPIGVGGTVLGSVFSKDTDDEVFSTLYYPNGRSAQVSVSWSDESQRKMSTRVHLFGTKGRIYVDRQECQVYLRDTATLPEGYDYGWNVKYTTDLTEPVWFYLRGEEYSAQLDTFVKNVQGGVTENVNDFASAAMTDRVMALMVQDSKRGPATTADGAPAPVAPQKKMGWFARWRAGRKLSTAGAA